MCADNEGGGGGGGDSERQKGKIRGFKQAGRQAVYGTISLLSSTFPLRRERGGAGEGRKKCSNGSSLSSPEPRERKSTHST